MQTSITVQTKNKREVIDITDSVERALGEKSSNEIELCHLFLTHTTAAIATADLDSGADSDMLDAFERIVPKLAYQHLHNPDHMPDHILSSLIGTSLTIPITDNHLILGTWQRVILIEFDGPRDRKIVVSF